MNIRPSFGAKGLSGRQLHLYSAKLFGLAALGLVLAAILFRVSGHPTVGWVFGCTALLDAGLAFAQYALSRKADKGAA